jgi:hypothetical protein
LGDISALPMTALLVCGVTGHANLDRDNDGHLVVPGFLLSAHKPEAMTGR